MKELPFSLKRYLVGLSKESVVIPNVPGLDSCYGFRVVDNGLGKEADLEDIVGAEVDFPYPQVFRGIRDTILAGKDKIWKKTASGWEEVKVYSEDGTEYGTIPEGTLPWYFVDFGYSWLLGNGLITVYKTRKEGLLGGEDKPRVVKSILARTGARLGSRTLLGGFIEGESWNKAWLTVFDRLSEESRFSFKWVMNSFLDNTVIWSPVGGDLLTILEEGHEKYGTLGEGFGYGDEGEWEYWEEVFRQNQLGWTFLPLRGPIYRLEPLGKVVVAYAAGGIAILVPQTVDEVPTFGVEILSRNIQCLPYLPIVAGDNEHIVVAGNGAVYRIGGDLRIEELGFRDKLRKLITGGKAGTGVYNSVEDEYYLTFEDRTLLLSRRGLSVSSSIIVGGYEEEGSFKVARKEQGIRSAYLETNIFDLDIRAIKQITSLRISASSYDGAYVRVYSRINPEEPWSFTDWLRLSPEGLCHPGIAGVDFKIGFLARGNLQTDVFDITGSFVVQDNREKRGLYAPAGEVD